MSKPPLKILMTRKHFQLIADVLKSQKPKGSEDSNTFRYWLSLVEEFAIELARTNGRFDKERFFRACGYL